MNSFEEDAFSAREGGIGLNTYCLYMAFLYMVSNSGSLTTRGVLATSVAS